MKTKLLIIDPMPLARKVLSEGLRASSAVEVLGAVSGARAAERRLATSRADVLLIDVEPPVELETEALRQLREHWPIPVVLYTALEGLDQKVFLAALQPSGLSTSSGSTRPGMRQVAVISKPATGLVQGTVALLPEIEAAICKAHHDDLLRWRKKREVLLLPVPVRAPGRRVLALGASTGGTEALAEVLARLPRETPGAVIVQHMPAGFTRSFAERLDELSELEVQEAADGDEVRPGRALVAPGGYQMVLAPSGSGHVVRVLPGEKVNGHCPSVDVLMLSVAKHAGPRAIGVLLTGMGSDGAEGMCAIRQAGGGTIAQDEASSVVYGMPREAYLRGGAEVVAPLAEIARQVLGMAARERP